MRDIVRDFGANARTRLEDSQNVNDDEERNAALTEAACFEALEDVAHIEDLNWEGLLRDNDPITVIDLDPLSSLPVNDVANRISHNFDADTIRVELKDLSMLHGVQFRPNEDGWVETVI